MSQHDLLYTKEHDWIRVENGVGAIGITDHAQHELGDVVYIEMPKIGDRFEANQPFGTIESVKAVSELFMPVSAEVVAINEELGNAPDTLNTDPYGKGWLLRIKLLNPAETETLLSAEKYEAYIQAL